MSRNRCALSLFVLLAGCTSQQAAPSKAEGASARLTELRARFRQFPARAARDLGAKLTVSATAHLPSRADEATSVEDDHTHVAVSFRLRGASPAPKVEAEGLALYHHALAGADLVHRPSVEGTEDYVAFDAKPEREELVYDVDVTRAPGLRLVSNTLEFLDEGGTPRLRMAPPWVEDAHGAPHAARTTVEGCAFDENPDAPWGRPITRAGADRCTVRVTWGEVDYPALVDPSWGATGSMIEARMNHTLTHLCTPEPCSGSVLAVGGYSISYVTALSTAELFDGVNAFAASGTMIAARAGHTATRLTSGKVLIAGGKGSGTAELYNAGSFGGTGTMAIQRSYHTATLMPSGKVLIVGGRTTSVQSLSEQYDPTGGTFAFGSVPNTQAREGHTATLLSTGKVLIVGGYNGTSYLSTAELFDGISASAATGSMAAPRGYHTASLLSSGKVLVAGGATSSTANLSTAELFTTSSFAATGSLSAVRAYHTATTLGSGAVLIAGGRNASAVVSTTELFNGTSAFATAGTMSEVRAFHAACLVNAGTVLISGGSASSTAVKTADLYKNLPVGLACAANAECSSGQCNELCCTAACTGACRTCSATGACQNVVSAEDPGSCSGASICDATGACKLKNGQPSTVATSCASGFVANGVCCDTACGGQCDSCNRAGLVGTCGPESAGFAGVPSCAPYLCKGAATCPTACSTVADCTSGNECTGNKCVPPDAGVADTGAVDAGGADTFVADTSVTDTFVDDTFVDETSVDGATADAEPDGGAPADTNTSTVDAGDPLITSTTGLVRCSGASGCAKGAFCVDGVCCDSACTGPCMTCLLAESPGKCVPQPRGLDLHGDCQSATCATVCGGRGACEPVVPGAQCARARCTDASHGLSPAYCPDVNAACNTAAQVPFDCGPYACFAPSGSCLSQCSRTDDCALGFLCDVASGKCTPAPPAEDDSGCAVSTPAGDSHHEWLTALGALGLAALARRRRAV